MTTYDKSRACVLLKASNEMISQNKVLYGRDGSEGHGLDNDDGNQRSRC